MKNVYLTLSFLTISIFGFAQAGLQVIHNSVSGTVDVYANGALLLDDFEYRTATPFVTVPSDTLVQVAVAPATSTSVDDAIATFDLTFEAGKNYVAVASGIVGDMDFPFTLHATDKGQQGAMNGTKFELMAYHGSTGAPAVNLTEISGAPQITDLAYGQFTDGYVELDEGNTFFDVAPAATPNVNVGTFFVNTAGAAGASGVAFASGVLGGTPQFDILIALPNGAVITMLPVSAVQIIHNSSYSQVTTIDLYANDALLVNDMTYLSATGFTFLPSRTNFDIGVAPPNSTSSNDAMVTIPGINFEMGKTYIVIATGIPGNADAPFELVVNDQARIFSEDPAGLDILSFHGSEGAPAVDIAVDGVGTVVENLAYGEFDPYQTVAPENYILQVSATGSDDLVGSYFAPLAGAEGLAITVMAGGILGGDPAFGTYAVIPSGQVLSLQGLSRTQIIHNSANPTVDVYADANLLLDDFDYRTATPFTYLPAGVDINLGVATSDSQSSDDAIFNQTVNLDASKSYIVMATGLVGDMNTPFDLAIFDEARERNKDNTKVAVLVYHGSTDAPTVDVTTGGAVLVDDASYGDFAGYLEVDPLAYQLDITPGDDNNTIVASFMADLNGLGGGALTVFASGYLSGQDPAFGLWATLPDGTTFPLTGVSSTDEVDLLVDNFTIAPNPVVDQAVVSLNLNNATRAEIVVVSLSGKQVATIHNGEVAEGINTFTLNRNNLAEGVYYLAVKTEVGTISQPFMVTK